MKQIFYLLFFLFILSCKKQEKNDVVSLDSDFFVLFRATEIVPGEIDSFKVKVSTPLYFDDGTYTGVTINQESIIKGANGSINFKTDKKTNGIIYWENTKYYSNGTTGTGKGFTNKVFFGTAGIAISF